ncbi:hypothetical protein NIES3974_08750 [Calothrix sp. NIES-3974]|nr:hypothetical protein NIES3974_08750 [Calothrix sp. NIES-3974]
MSDTQGKIFIYQIDVLTKITKQTIYKLIELKSIYLMVENHEILGLSAMFCLDIRKLSEVEKICYFPTSSNRK